jgi:hypothetical protein
MSNRSPVEVALQIRDVVPEAHKARFESLANTFSYKAIEQMHGCWARPGNVCNSLLGPGGVLAQDWQVEMISILTMKSKEEVLADAVQES